MTLGMLLLVIHTGLLHGQPKPAEQPLILQGLTPGGGRTSVTESKGTLQFAVSNPNGSDREARVAVFYPEQPEIRFARDLWIPARSTVTSWLTIGPAPSQGKAMSREFQAVLEDRTDGKNRIVLPSESERIRSRAVLYRRREPSTSLMVDGDSISSQTTSELLTFARLPRAGSFSEQIHLVTEGPLPLSPEALEGVDVFIVAGNRLAADPPGLAALRQWVQKGGRLWVMLDMTDANLAAPILGDDFEVGIVDRVGLNTVRLRGVTDEPTLASQQVEQPISIVRVVTAENDRLLATVDGWPAAFSRRVGRGKILFTTLGARGWSKPRPRGDKNTPFPPFPEFPVPLGPVSLLSMELFPPTEAEPNPSELFHSMLTEEIGYSVIGRGGVALILGGFVLSLAGLYIVLRRRQRLELLGWLAPLIAAVAAICFVASATLSRHSLSPTMGMAAIVDPHAGTDEAVVSGLFAVFHPAPGPVSLGTRHAAILGLDTSGLEGQTRIRIETDTDCWHWEGLKFPAGIRTGTFRSVMKTGPVSAMARFGPAGIEGQIAIAPFTGATDAMILSRANTPLGVRLETDGKFTSGIADELSPGQFLTGTVLSDRQQRRQEVYRRLYDGPATRNPDKRNVLCLWADTPEVPITSSDDTKMFGRALLRVPLVFERTPPETQVIIPRGMVPHTRFTEDGKQLPVTMSAQYPAEMRLRFQIPDSVCPLNVEHATLFIQARTPARHLIVTGGALPNPMLLFDGEAGSETIRIEITEASILRLDDQGRMSLNIRIGETAPGSAENTAWKIDSMSLQVTGKTGRSPR